MECFGIKTASIDGICIDSKNALVGISIKQSEFCVARINLKTMVP